jgi:peroxiredoxin
MLCSAVRDFVSHACAQKELPYPLLSDRKRVFIGALGAADGQKTKRSHFVFAQGGKLLDKKVPVKPADRFVPSFSCLVCTQYSSTV